MPTRYSLCGEPSVATRGARRSPGAQRDPPGYAVAEMPEPRALRSIDPTTRAAPGERPHLMGGTRVRGEGSAVEAATTPSVRTACNARPCCSRAAQRAGSPSAALPSSRRTAGGKTRGRSNTPSVHLLPPVWSRWDSRDRARQGGGLTRSYPINALVDTRPLFSGQFLAAMTPGNPLLHLGIDSVYLGRTSDT